MKNETQSQWVIEQLEDQGFISRNQCLQNYISRLGAIMCDLNKKGWVFTTHYDTTKNGKDYIYTLVSRPQVEQTDLFGNPINRVNPLTGERI